MAEPARSQATAGEEQRSLRGALRHIGAHRRDYLSLTIAMGLQLCVGSASAWLVALFQRQWQWSVGEIAGALGALFLVFGPFGSVAGGWLSDRFAVRGLVRAPQRVVVLGMALFVPAAIFFPLLSSPAWAIVGCVYGVPAPFIVWFGSVRAAH